MHWHKATKTTAIDLRGHALIVTLMLGTLWSATNVLGQTMRFLPIQSAPLGSPVGTIGEPVTPVLNHTLGCWELTLPGGGIEVHLDVQPAGWGDAPGSPTLGAIQATVDPTGYSNGLGGDLVPKGWPETPNDGIFYTLNTCTESGDTCNVPFDLTCGGGANGTCMPNPNWVMPPCTHNLPCFATPSLDYSWASAAQADCNVDDGEFKTMGGLILNVPPDAAGTYVIAFSPDPNNSFMTSGDGAPIPGLVFTSACITIIMGACCMDTNSDGQQDFCQNDTSAFDCAAAAGSFGGDGSTCSGQVGACCLDSNRDGFDDTCTEMDRNCCLAEVGSFLGAGSSCSGQVGACCLDSDGDGFTDTCKVMNQTCCATQGGSFGAAESPCSALSGACCLEDGTCVELNLTCCESQGGSSAGVGSVCKGDSNGNRTDDACEEGFPAVSQWGLIVLVLFLLVGIKISFDRRQPA